MRSRWLCTALLALALTVSACGTGAGESRSTFTKLHEKSGEGFTIAVPAGWDIDSRFSGSLVKVEQVSNPSNRALFGGLLPVSDWISGPCLQGLNVTDPNAATTWGPCHTNGRESQVSASRAISEIAKEGANLGAQTQITAISGDSQGSSAEATVRRKQGGRETEEIWRVTVVSIRSPAAEGLALAQGRKQSYWDSYAFLTGCGADPGKLGGLKQLCGAVLTSFKPREWLSERINFYSDNNRARIRLVESNTGGKSSIPAVDYPQELQKYASNGTYFQSWKDVLAGSLQLQDSSTGDIYSMAQDNKKQHCITGTGPIGYDSGRPSECVHDAKQFSPGS